MIATVPDEIEAVFARGDLIAAVAQDCNNSEVLMVAWMNREALLLTLTTSRVGAVVEMNCGRRARPQETLKSSVRSLMTAMAMLFF